MDDPSITSFTKQDVVLMALGSLGGAVGAIDTEDVAIAAHTLAPSAFGWRKHPEHIDLDAVRTSLRHEKEAPNARLDGSIRIGWYLTPAGQIWLRTHSSPAGQASVRVAATPARTAKRRAETRNVAAIVDRLRSSAAFRAWASGQAVESKQAADVFRIDEYTQARDRHLKTSRVAEIVADTPELTDFLATAIPAALALAPPTAASSSPSPSKESR